MKKVHINEDRYKRLILKEYHHALDNGLKDICWNVAYYFLNHSNEIDINYYHVFECGELGDINFMVKKGFNCTYDSRQKRVEIGIDNIKEGNIQRLSSLLYHEIGHATNVNKANTMAQIMKDFEQPIFIGVNDDESKRLGQVIYLFYTREMKARCFEATMWLREAEEMPTLEEYYSDRCTNITKMRKFIKELQDITQEGENGPRSKRIKDLYVQMVYSALRSRGIQYRASFKKKSNLVIKWFEKQFDWFKKRVDKIYYDEKMSRQIS